MEDLKPLIGPALASAIEDPRIPAGEWFMPDGGLMPHHAVAHPVPQDEADRLCIGLVGQCHDRTFVKLRKAWWAFLREADTGEARLSAERMINAINLAMGMAGGDRLIRIRAEHEDRRKADAIAEKKRIEADAVTRWTGFRADD